MTKTLTEQWREGTLPDGYYYVVSKWSGKIEINDYYEGCWQDLKEEYIKEVLAPVPSYDEIKCLQEQLKEANTIIKKCADYCTVGCYYDERDEEMAFDSKTYLKKWGVK